MFRIALTADFFSDGQPTYPDFDLATLDECPAIAYSAFAEHRLEIGPDQIGDANALLVLGPKVTRKSVSASNNLLAVCRFGVGYDGVDVDACTEADVALVITSGAVDRPVAEATVGWMIALSHCFRTKDRLVREGRWNDRSSHMGSELRDRTLGIIGFGGIARSLVALLSSFGMKQILAFDPYVDGAAMEQAGVTRIELDELLRQSDFVSIHCPLTDSTRNLISQPQLALMKPSAYLINTARGNIVDEDALYSCLQENKIAGAALDCFAVEPVVGPSRFAQLDNVLLAPHAIAWTHELFRDIGNTACRALTDLSQSRRPSGIVNPEVFDRQGFQDKWQRITDRAL